MSNEEKPVNLPKETEVYADDDIKFEIKTAEDFKTVQEVKMKWHILKKAFYLVVFFACLFAIMGGYILVTDSEKFELVSHGITGIVQIITVIIQAVTGTS